MTRIGRSWTIGRSWDWVVVIGATLSQVIVGGLNYSVPIYLVEWQQDFGIGAGALSVIAAEFEGFMALFAILAGPLCKRCGCRIATFVSGGVACLALCMVVFATQLWQFHLFAIVTGAAIGVVMVTSLVVITYYFTRYLGITNGLVIAGFSIGGLAMSPVMETLNEKYGWRGAILIHSAITGHLLVGAAVLRPSAREEAVIASAKRRSSSYICRYASVSAGDAERGEKETVIEESVDHRLDGDVVSGMGSEMASRGLSRPDSEAGSESNLGRKSDVESRIQERVLHRVYSSADPVYESEIESMGQLREVSRLKSDLKHRGVDSENSVSCQIRQFCRSECGRWIQVINDRFDLSALFCNVDYCFFLFATATTSLCMMACFYFFPLKLVFDLGRPKIQASLILTITGACSAVSRLLNGFIVDSGIITASKLFTLSMTAIGFSALFNPLSETYWSQLLLAGLLGIGIGNMLAMGPLLCRQYVGVSKVANAIGFFFGLSGIGIMIGLQIMGRLYDMTGSYDVPFYVVGSAQLLTVTVMVFKQWHFSHKPVHGQLNGNNCHDEEEAHVSTARKMMDISADDSTRNQCEQLSPRGTSNK